MQEAEREEDERLMGFHTGVHKHQRSDTHRVESPPGYVCERGTET